MSDITLGEVINGLFESNASRMNTCMPATIVRVREASGAFIDVQPAIHLWSEDGETLQRAPILNVPVVFPISSTGGLQFELNPGDPILLIFSQRGLDVWKKGKGMPEAPIDGRMFDPRDCFAIPSPFPIASTPAMPSKHTNSHSKNDVVLVHNIGKPNEVEIRLKKNGDVYIKTTGEIKVDASTAVVNATTTINGNTTINGTLNVSQSITTPTVSATSSLKVQGVEMNNHTHGGVESGGGTSGGPISGS